MKKLISLVVLLFLVASCKHYGVLDHHKIKSDVYIDTDYSWINNRPVNNRVKSLRAVTVRIINRKYIPVEVSVECRFREGGELFGETTTLVGARNDKTVMIRGYARAPVSEWATCSIAHIR